MMRRHPAALPEIRLPVPSAEVRRSRCSSRAQHPFRPLPTWAYRPLLDGPIMPIWFPSTTLPVAIHVDEDTLQAVAGDDVVLLGIGPAQRRVVAVDVDSLQRIALSDEYRR